MRKAPWIILVVVIILITLAVGYFVYDNFFATYDRTGKTKAQKEEEYALESKAAYEFGDVKELDKSGETGLAPACVGCDLSGYVSNYLVRVVYNSIKTPGQLSGLGWNRLEPKLLPDGNIRQWLEYKKTFDGKDLCIVYADYTEPDLTGDTNGATVDLCIDKSNENF